VKPPGSRSPLPALNMMDEYDNPDEYEESQEAGPQGLLERLTRRYLGDVRIHDSHQAGELARRLGARAFTVGRDIYVRPELVRPMTRRGASLLAHELHHVAEQTGSAVGPPEMPLLAPSGPGQAGSGARSYAQGGHSPTSGAGGRMAVQREQASSPSEQGAERAEAAALNSPRRRKPRRASPPDPEELAEQVYRLMLQEILLDHERAIGK